MHHSLRGSWYRDSRSPLRSTRPTLPIPLNGPPGFPDQRVSTECSMRTRNGPTPPAAASRRRPSASRGGCTTRAGVPSSAPEIGRRNSEGIRACSSHLAVRVDDVYWPDPARRALDRGRLISCRRMAVDEKGGRRRATTRMRAFLFADLRDYTKFVEARGDLQPREAVVRRGLESRLPLPKLGAGKASQSHPVDPGGRCHMTPPSAFHYAPQLASRKLSVGPGLIHHVARLRQDLVADH